MGMATIGLVAQHYFRFKGLAFNDGMSDLSSVPSNLGAISTFPGSAAFGALVLTAGIFELRMSDKDGKTPGDFGDPMNWSMEDLQCSASWAHSRQSTSRATMQSNSGVM